MRQRIRTDIMGIRYYAGLSKRVAHVWVQTVSEHILVVADPRHNNARGKATGVPLSNCVLATLQAQRVEIRIRQFPQQPRWQAVGESHHLGEQQLTNLASDALFDLAGCIRRFPTLDNLIPELGEYRGCPFPVRCRHGRCERSGENSSRATPSVFLSTNCTASPAHLRDSSRRTTPRREQIGIRIAQPALQIRCSTRARSRWSLSVI